MTKAKLKQTDQLYKKEQKALSPFTFNQDVSEVFDDMISRSIPGYDAIQSFVQTTTETHLSPNDHIYDLGCSTGTTLHHILTQTPHALRATALDYSEPMLTKAKEKLRHFQNIQYLHRDLNDSFPIQKSALITAILTLQFIDKSNRKKVLSDCYQSLESGGLFILVEKVHHSDPSIQDLLTTTYHRFKSQQGYSDIEIRQKQEALKTVLCPYTFEENMLLLKAVGFSNCDCFYRWGPFVGIVAKKD